MNLTDMIVDAVDMVLKMLDTMMETPTTAMPTEDAAVESTQTTRKEETALCVELEDAPVNNEEEELEDAEAANAAVAYHAGGFIAEAFDSVAEAEHEDEPANYQVAHAVEEEELEGAETANAAVAYHAGGFIAKAFETFAEATLAVRTAQDADEEHDGEWTIVEGFGPRESQEADSDRLLVVVDQDDEEDVQATDDDCEFVADGPVAEVFTNVTAVTPSFPLRLVAAGIAAFSTAKDFTTNCAVAAAVGTAKQVLVTLSDEPKPTAPKTPVTPAVSTSFQTQLTEAGKNAFAKATELALNRAFTVAMTMTEWTAWYAAIWIKEYLTYVVELELKRQAAALRTMTATIVCQTVRWL